jgi:hypothetical protein
MTCHVHRFVFRSHLQQATLGAQRRHVEHLSPHGNLDLVQLDFWLFGVAATSIITAEYDNVIMVI